jgi:hypothetical protein
MEDKLRDIKPLLEIPDSSYYIYIALIVFALFLLFGVVFFVAKKFWDKRKGNMKKVYLERLKMVDWTDSKKASYEVTFFGRTLLDVDPRVEEIYTQLLPMLEAYKYRKEVPSIDDETMKQYNLLVHVIDESI